MAQLTCGGLINSNTGPLGHTSSKDVRQSFRTRWINGWFEGITEAIATPPENDRWW